MPTNSFGVGIETEENTLVSQWVLVLSPRAPGNLGASRANDTLDHGAVNDTSDIGVGDLGGWETERR